MYSSAGSSFGSQARDRQSNVGTRSPGIIASGINCWVSSDYARKHIESSALIELFTASKVIQEPDPSPPARPPARRLL
jgi:hypothetical protein